MYSESDNPSSGTVLNDLVDLNSLMPPVIEVLRGS